MTDRFPELEALGALLPEGTVIDGEVLPWKRRRAAALRPDAAPHRPQGAGPKILAEVPVVLVAYDLLELARRRRARAAARVAPRASWKSIAPPGIARWLLSPAGGGRDPGRN